ncbi:lysine-sensitive aspartokinase 3 [Gallaecimonas kandeliae]|uniref:lysine-sensitive aspartokinase 3 n=1 Tax=Gallaecimonas kandeliae TaxID=3029055 RepID=UPI002649FB02|nr:lysine-sensitive aspartokinase 3 [Gallaecimonas kandeliae]WKE64379.1 lysine-sensitive aspartokinase 3 [Gallaecimonas kandeliae]
MNIPPSRVLKFGGTSVADFDAQGRSAQLVANQAESRIVVVSAAAGVTNALVGLSQAVDAGAAENFRTLIHDRQQHFFEALGSPDALKANYWSLLEELDGSGPCEGQARDRLLSLGERFSSLFFAERLRQLGLPAVQLPARFLIATDSQFGHGEPDVARTRQQVQVALADHQGEILVTEGFVGADPQGNLTTLGRGGSDYSAALLAEAADADWVEIWTDVKGLYTTDPRLVPSARPLAELSFAQAAELATFGAKVLHPKTLWPAMRHDIPVFIGSTLDASGGTVIRREVQGERRYAALALRKNQTLVKITSPEMLYSYGFLARAFSLLAKHHISVDLVTTSEISIALTLDERGSEQVLSQAVLEELRELGTIEVQEGLALVALVGDDLNSTPKVAADVFDALDGINVPLICHGASPHNLCFLVAGEDGPLAIQRLHARLFDKRQVAAA